MKVGQEVEFQFGHGDFALGTVVAYDEETEMVLVEDEEGIPWKGFADYVRPLE